MSQRLTSITQQRLCIVGTNEGGKISMSTHQKSVRAGLKSVAMRRAETHEATEGCPAVVITVVHADEDVGRVLHARDRKSTRLNSSHANISYAVFCLKKKKKKLKFIFIEKKKNK